MSTDLLEQFLNYLAIEKGLRPKSLEAYRRDLQDWLDFAAERERAVTSGSIDSVLSLFSCTCTTGAFRHARWHENLRL